MAMGKDGSTIKAADTRPCKIGGSSWSLAALSELRDHDGQQTWAQPTLPDVAERAQAGLRVEVLCWLDSLPCVEEALAALWPLFRSDATLVMVRRSDNATRLVLYTSAREATVRDRLAVARAHLRPWAFGAQVSSDPDWSALQRVLAATS
jgi:hypothetical protein